MNNLLSSKYSITNLKARYFLVIAPLIGLKILGTNNVHVIKFTMF